MPPDKVRQFLTESKAQGKELRVLPGKGVYTIKPPYKFKARGVACGNHALLGLPCRTVLGVLALLQSTLDWEESACLALSTLYNSTLRLGSVAYSCCVKSWSLYLLTCLKLWDLLH